MSSPVPSPHGRFSLLFLLSDMECADVPLLTPSSKEMMSQALKATFSGFAKEQQRLGIPKGKTWLPSKQPWWPWRACPPARLLFSASDESLQAASPCFSAASAGKTWMFRAKLPANYTLCLSVLLASALAALGTCSLAGSSRTSSSKSSPLYGEAAGTLHQRLMTGRNQVK